MLRRLQYIEWTFSNTAEIATGFVLAVAVLSAIL